MRYELGSGNVALDLAGTVSHRHAEDRHDRLPDPAALAAWTVRTGLVDQAPPADAAGLAATTELREAVYRLARATLEGRTGETGDRELVNRVAALPPVRIRLLGGGGLAREGDLTAVRATVAIAAIELLGGPDVARLKACGAHPCSRLYVDRSRRGDRRWCDMSGCGNRAKAAAYRRRKAAAETGRAVGA
ncbi:putative RNA-binding Zn ribbon-like protein [Pseudonocardia eucalypti]|nr:putative RNA-binding Zn ribbon-like protein [Pseudonocardia eucalypti]